MKLFWSWQSDNHQSSGRHFVRDVLAELARELNSEAEDAERPEIDAEDDEDDGRIVVDHDTLNVGGSPPIADTILRKIHDAAVFIADVTPVGKTAGGKFVPNPNVMIELGYALKVLKHERIVLVMNQAEGASLKRLPFDLRHWRAPVTYSLSREATEERKIEVAKELKEALRKPIENSLKTAVRAQREERRRTVREPDLSVSLDQDEAGPWLISQHVDDLDVKGLAAIQEETPHLSVPPQGLFAPALHLPRLSPLSSFGYSKPLSEWSGAEIDRYNRSVNDYHRKYEGYLEAMAEYKRLMLRSFLVKLQVCNNGTAPATDIDVEITFPSGIVLYDDEHKGPEPPEAPEPPPRVPLGPGEAFARPIAFDSPRLLPHQYLPRTTFYYPEERQVQFQISDLKHHHAWSADAFRVSFATAPDVKPFEIEYVITANEPIEPIRGSVRFECSLAPS